ncbi:hypothetical protein CERZMDRAFT_93892 [Cercospora zeae-maydis SCOH1-5]|uniref:Uncharacterized protein n=1 Tax=Cercospora zeae-maydis SCOH1-5 TaxID=717836 RepID=A0A6A6FTJ3_9PEZI|nr:hypothetical protein CERZMDRAFT_93892 [Cercospora zeae-maydis SCOH1-5]
MRLRHLFHLFLTAASPTTALHMRTWHGPAKRTNATALVECLDEMHANWAGKGNDNHWNAEGWECAGSTWQIRGKFARGRLSAPQAIAKCSDQLLKAAERGEAWFKCKVKRTLAQVWLGWSPRGWKMCSNPGGVPCQLEDGVLPEDGDGGAACRLEGFCPGGPEIERHTSVSTKTVDRTVTISAGGYKPIATEEPGEEGQVPKPPSSVTEGIGEGSASSTATSNSEWESFTSVWTVPIVVGPGPPTTSTSKPATRPSPPFSPTPKNLPPSPTYPQPTSASLAYPNPISTNLSTSSAAPSETIIVITMTSGETPLPITSATPTFPPSTRRPIMSTTIQGTLYTYLKESTMTSVPPPSPITTTIQGIVYTFKPVTDTVGPRTSKSWGRPTTWMSGP